MTLDAASAVDLALEGDLAALRRLCLAALDGGAPVAGIVDVLAGVQREVGERWLRGRITTADEHRSTAAIDAALAAMELRHPSPSLPLPVICVCAEGEWHALASRMVAVVLAAAGRSTIFLGASLPAGDLARFVAATDAAAVAISCSTVAALPGAARCVAAAVRAGARPAVGGHAFAAVPSAAEAMGAPPVPDLDAVIRGADQFRIPTQPSDLDHSGVAALQLADSHLRHAACQALTAEHHLSDEPHRAVLEEALRYALGFGRAAVLLRDGSVLQAHRPWLDRFLAGRSVPVDAGAVLDSLSAAATDVLADRGDVRRILAS